MQHSASSIALANRCHRAWWHCYRDKLRPPEMSWPEAKRAKARGDRLPAGAFGKALGSEVHRLAEIYLVQPPRRARRSIDWNDLPGLCLAELVPHLPPAGSVSRRNVERRFSVKVNGVSFRGLIDLVGAASRAVVAVHDHKTTRDIRAYALLPDAVARQLNQPKRSLRDDLQACLYVLAQAQGTEAAGGVCRWNYTETQRARRSLPVVQYIPRTHALTVAHAASDVARTVEAFETVEDATPNTTACDEYGGCWYRAEGHCRVPRKLGAVMKHNEQQAEEQTHMAKLSFKGLGAATAKANAAEETKAAKAKPAPSPVAETDDAEQEDEEETEEEETPAPRASKRVAKKSSKRAPRASDPKGYDVEDDDDAEDEEAPASVPSPRAAFDAATAGPDHILQFFGTAAAGLKGEAKINATALGELADHLAATLPRNPERAHCLRLLLQAGDCARRALEGGA